MKINQNKITVTQQLEVFGIFCVINY